MRKRIINSYFALLVSVIIIFTLIPSFAMATETLNAFEGLNTSNFNGADISVTKQFSTNKVLEGFLPALIYHGITLILMKFRKILSLNIQARTTY